MRVGVFRTIRYSHDVACKEPSNIEGLRVRSYNSETKEKSVIELSAVKERLVNTKEKRFHLPSEAVTGLADTVSNCEIAAKSLQNTADQKKTKLMARDMPAAPSLVKKARAENRMREFKWKPMSFSTPHEGVIYALNRLIGNYSEAKFAFNELISHQFAPISVLDYGSGIGGAFWAAKELWDKNLKEYCLVDPNEYANEVAMSIMRDPATGNLPSYVNFRRSIVGSASKRYDLVISQRVLSEIGSHENRLELVRVLWERTNKYLILIESHKKDHYGALMDARNMILSNSYKFTITDELFDELNGKGIPYEVSKSYLNNRNISWYERYKWLDANGVQVDTYISPGHIVAPCPHDVDCPMSGNSCSFSTIHDELRADGKTKSPVRNGTIKNTFSYFIFAKGMRPPIYPQSRALKLKKSKGCVTCKVCTAFDGLQQFTLSKKMGDYYKRARGTPEGGLFPLKADIVESDCELNVIREVFNDKKKDIFR